MATTPTTPAALVYEMLNNHLSSVAGATPIEFPGKDFDVPDDRAYLRVQWMPGIRERITIDSDGAHRYLGIYQVTVVRKPADGIVEPLQAAGVVAGWFPCDMKLKDGELVVRIMSDPAIAEPMTEKADLLTPVSVEYETFY